MVAGTPEPDWEEVAVERREEIVESVRQVLVGFINEPVGEGMPPEVAYIRMMGVAMLSATNDLLETIRLSVIDVLDGTHPDFLSAAAAVPKNLEVDTHSGPSALYMAGVSYLAMCQRQLAGED